MTADRRMNVKESEKLDKYLGQISGPCQRTGKVIKYDCDSDTNRSWSPWNAHQEPGKETRRDGDKRNI